MARGRRSLAIGLSIAVHAALGAAFMLIRPALQEKAPQIEVRVISRPNTAPSTGTPGSAPQQQQQPTGEKRASNPRGVRSVVAEGSVAAVEAVKVIPEGTETSTGVLARRSAAGNSGSVFAEAPLELDVKAGAGNGVNANALALNLELEKEAPGPNLEPSGGGTYRHEDSMFRARIEADGTVELEDKIVPVPSVGMNAEGRPSVEIPLDATDTLMRILGDDPYAYEKRKFLAATQELRAQMAERACKENLDASLLEIKPRMTAIWENRRFSHAEKKKRLFALWDECAEEGSPDVLKTSELIRASILGFIAEHLPPESHLAYSENDLAMLNATRRSRAEFLPYGRREN